MRKVYISSASFLMLCISIVLLSAGGSRLIESDSGKVLIHEAEVESYEGFFYMGKLFRPLEARSDNQRPAVLLIGGNGTHGNALTSLATELSRRGIVALIIDDYGQNNTLPEDPTFHTENAADAGYTFLQTRTFVRPGKIGVAAFSSAAAEILEADKVSGFNAVILVSPPAVTAEQSDSINNLLLVVPKFDEYGFTHNSYFSTNTNQSFSNLCQPAVIHRMSPYNSGTIKIILDWFNQKLKIENDSPLWFNSSKQIYPYLLLCNILCFLFLVISLIPLQNIFYSNSKNKSGSPFNEETTTAKFNNDHFSWAETFGFIILGTILYLLSSFCEIKGKSIPFLNRYEGISSLSEWFCIITITFILRFILKRKFHPNSVQIGASHFIFKELFFNLTSLAYFYGFTWFLIFLIKVNPVSVSGSIKLIDSFRLPGFLFLTFLFTMFFYFLVLFTNKFRKKDYFICILSGLGGLFFYCLIAYLPLFLTGTEGWHLIMEKLPFMKDHTAVNYIFENYVLGMNAENSLYGSIAVSFLLIIQNRLLKFASKLSASFLCGTIMALILISETIIH